MGVQSKVSFSMGKIILCIFALISLSVVEAASLLSKDGFNCPGDGLYPDIDNCQCYWNCANHVAFHTCCGPGTVYDPINMDCDFPSHVNCGDRPMPGSTRPPSTTKSTTTHSTSISTSTVTTTYPTSTTTTPTTTAPSTTTTTNTTTTTTTTATTSTMTTTTTQTTTATTTITEDCSNFSQSTCPIDEDTMVGFMNTDTAQECQELCRDTEECTFFTFFVNQCYLLNTCDYTQDCPRCVSGPEYPDVNTCASVTLGPWSTAQKIV